MSKKDALAFLNRLSTDRELGRQVSAAEKGEVIQIASRAGFSIEWDELESIVREIKGAEGEISDGILELVAGGLSLSDIEKWVSDNVSKVTGTFDLFPKN